MTASEGDQCQAFSFLHLICSLLFARWAVILAFDVRVERDAQEMADSLGVKIFSADIIYHLFDAFLKHRQVSIIIVSLTGVVITSAVCAGTPGEETSRV